MCFRFHHVTKKDIMFLQIHWKKKSRCLMKGAWCYDGEIKCALGRFYCECGLCCTYSSSPKCVWSCVSLRASQGLYEQTHLGSEHHLLDEGGCLGSGYIPCLMQDCPPWQCCARLPGLGTEGPHAEGMGSSGWRFWGQAFSFRDFTNFHCSWGFTPLFSDIGKFL